MRHRTPGPPEQELPEDSRARQLAELNPGWLVWWSPRAGRYRARLDLPRDRSPAEIEAADLWELEFHIHQYRELAASIRRLLGQVR